MASTNEFSLLKYDEIQLNSNPLVVVICQISFESVLAINDQTELSKFQKIISDKYPIFKADLIEEHTVDVAQKAFTSTQLRVSRFSDKDEHWRVTLTKDAVSLETFNYVSRSDFKERFEFVVSAFHKIFQPKLINRIGVRYVNRLTNNALNKVQQLVNPSLLSVYNSDLVKFLSSNISEAFFTLEGKYLLARWGLLPASSTIDPNAIKPIPETSWIIDIDSSVSVRNEWVLKNILDEVTELTKLNYGFFRWATTQEFLDHYGVSK